MLGKYNLFSESRMLPRWCLWVVKSPGAQNTRHIDLWRSLPARSADLLVVSLHVSRRPPVDHAPHVRIVEGEKKK